MSFRLGEGLLIVSGEVLRNVCRVVFIDDEMKVIIKPLYKLLFSHYNEFTPLEGEIREKDVYSDIYGAYNSTK